MCLCDCNAGCSWTQPIRSVRDRLLNMTDGLVFFRLMHLKPVLKCPSENCYIFFITIRLIQSHLNNAERCIHLWCSAEWAQCRPSRTAHSYLPSWGRKTIFGLKQKNKNRHIQKLQHIIFTGVSKMQNPELHPRVSCRATWPWTLWGLLLRLAVFGPCTAFSRVIIRQLCVTLTVASINQTVLLNPHLFLVLFFLFFFHLVPFKRLTCLLLCKLHVG